MRPISRVIALALLPLLAVGLWLGTARVSGAAPATPQASPVAACVRQGTPTSTMRATPVPIDDLTAADFELITNAVTIRMTPEGFQPRAFQYAVGHAVDATLINTDTCEHTFTIDDLDIDVVVPPGETRHVHIPPANYSPHPFHSRAPGDSGLEWTGLLLVYL
jgi:hypothetical protein